jgi:hypothetical protein
MDFFAKVIDLIRGVPDFLLFMATADTSEDFATLV